MQFTSLVEKLRLPEPQTAVEAVLRMSEADADELQSRWLMPPAIALPDPKPVWRPPRLLYLPPSHQVLAALLTDGAARWAHEGLGLRCLCSKARTLCQEART